MRSSIIGAIVAVRLIGVADAAPHRLRLHPNPALSILSIAEGADGFLWVAANDGLYRYDGFHYQKMTAYPFSSARFLAVTSDGSLWSGDFEGLARLRGGQFEVVARDNVVAMTALADKVYARLQADLTRFGVDGSVRHLGHRTRRDLTVDPSGKLWAICLDPKRVCSIDPSHPDSLQSIPLPEDIDYQQATADSKGRLWTAGIDQAFLTENGRPVLQIERKHSKEGSRTAPLMQGRNGELWFLGDSIRAIESKIEFRDRADYERFPTMAGFEDRHKHLWAASLGQGMVEWIVDPEWRRWFPDDLSGEATVQVLRDHGGSLVLGTQKNLYRQGPGESWIPLKKQQYRYEFLLPLDDGGFLASIREIGLARLSPDGAVVERVRNVTPPVGEYREIARDGKGRLWVGSKRGLYRIEGAAGSLRLRQEPLPKFSEPSTESPVELEVDKDGRLWVGYTGGVAWLDERDTWHKLDTDPPAEMVRSMALDGDRLWIAHRRAGAFSRLDRKGDRWELSPFAANAGYGPVDSDFIKRDSRGWIWRGTPQGVLVSDGRHFAPGDWIRIHPGNGLASKEHNQYGFFEDTDHTVWIAGEEGLTHLTPRQSWFDSPRDAPAPRITRAEADGRVFLFPEMVPPEMPAPVRILRIDVGSLEPSPFRDYPLRYRLLPLSKEWEISRDGTFEFAALPENSYTLEVGYTGDGPSAVGSYGLRVGPPPARSRVPGGRWPWLAGLVMAAGSLVPFVRRAPWFDRVNFRIEKTLFLWKRRYRGTDSSSSSGLAGAPNDYSGTTLAGRYSLGRVLSQGGFSIVYDARDLREDGIRVVVKVLNRKAGQESWVRDRFAHEVSALRSVDHPGVVRILDSWISPAGEPCLAMPFLNGKTLREALSENGFERARVARIAARLGEALAEVHSRGIIHRDLKPENLMLLDAGTEAERPVIIDFGTAGLRSGEDELAATTLLAGSFHYMAPERLTGHYSPASDVFSLAVIVLEMLTGKRLADLKAMFSEAQFMTELERALGAGKLARELAHAFDPDPRRRPLDVKMWTAGLFAD